MKRSAAWVTELRDKPLLGARFKLTGLYAALTLIVLIIFVLSLGVFRNAIISREIQGKLANPLEEQIVVDRITKDLQVTTIILFIFVLIAITFISYHSVQLTLSPIKVFLESHRRFIADASHELRTPLATMRSEIDVALLDPESLSASESVEILRSNLEEIERMSKILTNLLNLASFNDVSGEPPMGPVELSEIIRNSMERVSKAATAKRVDIIADRIAPLRVRGNVTALEEVVFNLLKNSVYYSHAGGKVEIELRPHDERQAELSIRDYGIGIAPAELEHIFEPFYRSERSLHMHKSGSGLGLPLAKEIVKRHKGSIHVASELDQGTMVTVFLPLVQSG